MLNEKNIFTNEFKKVEIENVVKEINKNGYFEFENALTNDAVSKIENDGKTKLDINQNKIKWCLLGKTIFFYKSTCNI